MSFGKSTDIVHHMLDALRNEAHSARTSPHIHTPTRLFLPICWLGIVVVKHKVTDSPQVTVISKALSLLASFLPLPTCQMDSNGFRLETLSGELGRQSLPSSIGGQRHNHFLQLILYLRPCGRIVRDRVDVRRPKI